MIVAEIVRLEYLRNLNYHKNNISYSNKRQLS